MAEAPTNMAKEKGIFRRLFSHAPIRNDDILSTEDINLLREKRSETATAIRKKKHDIRFDRLWNAIAVFFCLLTSVVLTTVSINSLWLLLVVLVVATAFHFVYSGNNVDDLYALQNRLERIDELVFLLEIRELEAEPKAMRQLSAKQATLERYYEMNISQMKRVFQVGVGIIIVGFLCIAVPIVRSFFYQTEFAVIASGVAGGVMLDLIGGVFVLLYSKTVESANAYQRSISDSSYAYLGNLLAAQITDDALREKTLSEMARELAKAKPEGGGRAG